MQHKSIKSNSSYFFIHWTHTTFYRVSYVCKICWKRLRLAFVLEHLWNNWNLWKCSRLMANGMPRCSQHFPHQCIRLLISIWREYNNQPIAAHCILFLLLLFYVLVLNLFFLSIYVWLVRECGKSNSGIFFFCFGIRKTLIQYSVFFYLFYQIFCYKNWCFNSLFCTILCAHI